MKCAKCHISVKPYFSYCPNCGARLHADGKPAKGLFLYLFAVFLVCAAAAYVIFLKPGPQEVRVSDVDKNTRAVDAPIKDASPFSRILFSSPKTDTPAVHLSVGRIAIHDIAGNIIGELPAAVSESGWVAIPVRLCIGGHSWYFYSPGGDELEIFGGILGDRDDVGIWQFKNAGRLSGPPVFPVKPDRPMTWLSIESEKSAELSGVSILSEQQNFYHIALDGPMTGPGVLIQDRKIVGWTFGSLPGAGYLWKGADESNLVYELSVYDLYRLTFENSREEQFIIAYSRDDISPMDRLEAFANGFRLESVLFDDNTPSHLKTEAVIAQMRSLISQIVDEGNPAVIASVFDGKVLSKAGDIAFLIDVLTLGNQVAGPEYAMDVVETVLADPGNFNPNQAKQIRQFRKELYRKWLTRLMDEGEYSKGLEVYHQAADSSLIDDPEINLLGVKLALVFNDWETAEEILYSHRFPIDMTDQVRILQGQIRELKFQEDKIVVRFKPETDKIPVSGVVNNRLRQDFVVDTGASMVTIPSAAARALGIEIDSSTPVQRVVTAGGVIEAPQITLNSIEVDGWTEYQVKAYVVDIPNQSGFGLLGLNYLNRFRMDLNTKAGVLTLAPR